MTTPIERAETTGEAVGRAYARTTASLVRPIRTAPAPRWPREWVRSGVVTVQRRARNVPRRLLSGLRVLLTRKRPDGSPLLKKTQKRPAKTRLGQAVGISVGAWWGWSWAAQEGVLPWVYATLTAAAISLFYALGEEPATTDHKLPPDTEESPTDTEDAPEETAEDDPLLAFTAQLIGNARGVHLDALRAALNGAAPNRERSTDEVRAALAQRGVHTRPSVRAPEGAAPDAPKKVRRGVHRDDLEAVIGPLPAPTPAGPSERVADPVAPTLTCDVARSATPVGDDVAGPVAAPVDMRKSA